MIDELELDMNMRSLVMNRNHMICIPSDQGLTGSVFGKSKTIYYNNFEGVTQSHFYPETDNIKAFKNLTSFLFLPMIGHDLRPNGVIQLYSFKQPITRLQVKKMIALRKFVGGCLDGINLMNKNLVTVVGAMSKVTSTTKAIESRASLSEIDQRQMIELQSYVKTAKKEITAMYTRSTTEPGF